MSIRSRKLVLHIGTAKAGSTSIQNALSSLGNSDTGVQPVKSFGFPNAKRLAMSVESPSAYSYFVDNHKVVTSEEFNNISKTIWNKVRHEINQSDANMFVSSSEFLSALIRGGEIDILQRELNKIFSEIDIIVYLRDQRSFLRSLWAQLVKGPSKSDQSFMDFMSQFERQRYMWDYSIFLKDWTRVFGVNNMKVTMLDPSALYGGDVVIDFFNKAGIAAKIDAPVDRQNVSPSWDQLEKIRFENFMRNNPGVAEKTNSYERPMDREQYDALVLEKVSDVNRWVNDTFFEHQAVKLPSIP